jgi:hypothetical protein
MTYFSFRMLPGHSFWFQSGCQRTAEARQRHFIPFFEALNDSSTLTGTTASSGEESITKRFFPLKRIPLVHREYRGLSREKLREAEKASHRGHEGHRGGLVDEWTKLRGSAVYL